ncbi:carbon-nitrogen hydrolase family protein [Psychrosphaera ytuae]|uniref:Carbon-nitrogen hydrolase family protein n=1 Tax=Psychrosphaera ytuae TaxID=2820710 RepID=A0A975DBS9_9GAMM|nr:carbon-nitrogen hydrolase family protein [Psychrosphaera ytuae]QTH63416.1 carbon-nitrogen hydrolase family protein [Psychrosphaera ytuae]
MHAFVLQMTSTPNVDENIAFVNQQLELAQTAGQLKVNSLVVLPECFANFGGRDKSNLAIAENLGEGQVQSKLARIANQYQIYLVAGSFPTLPNEGECTGDSPAKFMATCLVFNPNGHLIADYQKIHLFDVDVDDNTGSYRESDSTIPGKNLVCFDTEWGRVGVAICYDLRFPGLFQALRAKGVDAIVLPSAFTEKTGAAHWQSLLSARAIENQIYMIASNQNGVHQNGRETFGHSMVISPWGEVVTNAKRENGLFGTFLDKARIKEIRQNMPVSNHNQFTFVQKA